jgi:hypothetical protein
MDMEKDGKMKVQGPARRGEAVGSIGSRRRRKDKSVGGLRAESKKQGAEGASAYGIGTTSNSPRTRLKSLSIVTMDSL